MVYHYNVECSYLLRGTYTNYGGTALYPLKAAKFKQQSMRSCSLKKRGVHVYP